MKQGATGCRLQHAPVAASLLRRDDYAAVQIIRCRVEVRRWLALFVIADIHAVAVDPFVFQVARYGLGAGLPQLAVFRLLRVVAGVAYDRNAEAGVLLQEINCVVEDLVLRPGDIFLADEAKYHGPLEDGELAIAEGDASGGWRDHLRFLSGPGCGFGLGRALGLGLDLGLRLGLGLRLDLGLGLSLGL